MFESLHVVFSEVFIINQINLYTQVMLVCATMVQPGVIIMQQDFFNGVCRVIQKTSFDSFCLKTQDNYYACHVC